MRIHSIGASPDPFCGPSAANERVKKILQDELRENPSMNSSQFMLLLVVVIKCSTLAGVFDLLLFFWHKRQKQWTQKYQVHGDEAKKIIGKCN